jgi:hypothetical protein
VIKKYFDFGKPLIYRQFLGKRLFQNIRKYQPRGNHHHQHQFDDDGDNDHLTHLRNKRKSQQKYKVKDSYHNQWPCLHLSKKGVCLVHCSVCKTNFHVYKHAGKNDFQRHIESKMYQQLLKTGKSNVYDFVK